MIQHYHVQANVNDEYAANNPDWFADEMDVVYRGNFFVHGVLSFETDAQAKPAETYADMPDDWEVKYAAKS